MPAFIRPKIPMFFRTMKDEFAVLGVKKRLPIPLTTLDSIQCVLSLLPAAAKKYHGAEDKSQPFLAPATACVPPVRQ